MGILDLLRKRKPAAPPPTTTLGVGGTAVYGDGFIASKETSPDLRDRTRWRTLNEMAHNVAIVATAIRRRSALYGAVEWRWDPANDSTEAAELATFVEEQVHAMDTPWATVVKRAALFEHFGASVQEWTAKVVASGAFAGKLGLADIASRPLDTIERWPQEEGKLAEIVQRDPNNGGERRVPRAKLLYLVDGLLTDSPEGTGLLRHCAERVRRLTRFEQLQGWGFETDLGGVPLARVPQAELAKLPDKGAAMKAGIQQFLQNPIKRPGLGLELDSAVYEVNGQATAIPKWGLELLKAAATSHKEVGDAIKHLVWEMALILGVEHLLLGAGGGGSLAMQSQKSRDFYYLVVGTLNDVALAFRRDVLTPLWKLNGWEESLLPWPTFDRLGFQDLVAVVDGVTKLSAEDPRLPHVRQLFESWGLTAPPEDLLEQLAEERRAAAEAQYGLKRRLADEDSVDVDLDDDEEDD